MLERIQYAPSADFRAIECLDEKGRVGAMIGLDHWTPNSVQLHVAIDIPICARSLLRPTFNYVFVEAGRSVALGIVPAHRQRSVNLATRLGFEEVHRVADGWSNGIDLVMFEMHKDSCPWISGKAKQDGKSLAHIAAEIREGPRPRAQHRMLAVDRVY